MSMLRWLFLRWRADRLRTLALQAFARGQRLERKADDCDRRAEQLGRASGERTR